jgi:hypothetical protein
LNEWLKQPAETPVVVELAEPAAIPYQSGAILFTPFRKAAIPDLQLALAPVQVAARFQSRYNWLAEGTQRFLQAVMLEQRSGRKTAVQFLQQYRAPLVQAEEATRKKGADAAGGVAAASPADNTLLNTNDELYLRGKSGFVLYMLRDMVGEEKLQSVMASYSAEIDKQPAGFQHLVEQHSKQDLEWFFDDWVYRDRGLPEFYVESAYPRTLLGGNVNTYLVTVTIENRGNAGAEVPVLIQTPSGEKTVRVLVKAGEKGVGRIEVPVAPDQVTVNDGSVLERNSGNNVYKVSKPSGS